MHKLYMHHGVALLGGRANRSAKLGWQKERARPDACTTCAWVRILVSPEKNLSNRFKNLVKLELISSDMLYIYIYIYIYISCV